MQTLIELAQSRQDEALKSLAGLIADSRTQQSKLGLLENYKQDYQARLTFGCQSGMPAPVLTNFRLFMKQLDNAVVQQGSAVAVSQSRLEKGRDEWQQSVRKLQSFELLLARRTLHRQVIESRRNQAMQDELAARISSVLPSD